MGCVHFDLYVDMCAREVTERARERERKRERMCAHACMSVRVYVSEP